MPKEEWGVKRICPTTGKRFYDLNKTPVVSPYTGEVVDLEALSGKKSRAEPKPRAKPAAKTVNADAETVVLDDDDDAVVLDDDSDDDTAADLEIDDDLLEDDDDDDDVSLDDIADVAVKDDDD